MSQNKLMNDILIIGAGAIGGVTAAILHKNNVDVHVITRKGANFEGIKKRGLIIEGHEHSYNFPIYSDYNEVKTKFQHILVTVKNPSTEEVMKRIKPFVSEGSLIYSLQNGFGNTSVMRKYFPNEQVVAGVIGWGASYLGEGKFRVTSSTGDFVLGFEEGKNESDPRLIDIKKKLEFWKPTILTNNILGYRWSKLIVNSIIGSCGGLFGISVGDMLGNSDVQIVMSALKEEGLLVAEAHNIQLEKVDGMDIRNFFYKSNPKDKPLTRLKRHIMSLIISKIGSKRHGKIYSSLLTDIKRGQQTEVENLNGYIIKKAKEKGIETPVNSFLLNAIKEIELGKRKTGMHNLEEILTLAVKSRKKIKE